MQHNTVDSLITATYPDILEGQKEDTYFLDHTILSAKNDAVDDLNTSILEKFPGEQSVFISIDGVIIDRYEHYPDEFLNSLKVSSLPAAQLALKSGCLFILSCNINSSNGLCNGTRMILLEIRTDVLKCCILGGKHAGNLALILHLILEPSAQELPIKLSHHQFPVHVAFSMTINKSQGQSVCHDGLDLHIPIFSHGQLYVPFHTALLEIE